MNPTRRTLRTTTSTALAGGTFIAACALMPVSAWGAPLLLYGNITIDAVASATLAAGTKSDPPPTDVANGDPAKVEAFASHLAHGPGWSFSGFDYGTHTRHPNQPFASAQMNGSGFADLGVSGSSEGPGLNAWGVLSADIIATQRITNIGTRGAIDLDYTVPLIEITQRGTRFEGLVSQIGAYMFADQYDVNDNLIASLDGYRYSLDFRYEKPPTDYAILTYTASDDLLRDSGGLVDVVDAGCLGCHGKAVRPFSVSKRDFAVLDAGDYLRITYVLNAYQITGREGGGHALYGDPFALGSDGRNFLEFTAADTPVGAVPEPGILAMLLAGGLAALRHRRRWRHRRVQDIAPPDARVGHAAAPTPPRP